MWNTCRNYDKILKGTRKPQMLLQKIKDNGTSSSHNNFYIFVRVIKHIFCYRNIAELSGWGKFVGVANYV